MSVHLWSTTASSNGTADPSVNAAEGMAASALNGSCRAAMAAFAKFRDDLSGKLVTTGTSTAYVLTSNQGFTSLFDGMMITCRFHVANGASPTLEVDLTGAKPIASVYGTAVPTGDIFEDGIHTLTYNATDDKFILHKTTSGGWPAGTIAIYENATAPLYWTKETTHNDKAFRIVSGSASSGGTSAFSTVLASRTLTADQLPAHSHGAGTITTNAAGGHNHSYTRWSSSANNLSYNAAGVDDIRRYSDTWTTTSAGDHSHTVSGNVGDSGDGNGWDFDVAYTAVILASKD